MGVREKGMKHQIDTLFNRDSNMKAMKVLMAIADDNRIKFRIVMRSVAEIGFRFEKLNSI